MEINGFWAHKRKSVLLNYYYQDQEQPQNSVFFVKINGYFFFNHENKMMLKFLCEQGYR